MVRKDQKPMANEQEVLKEEKELVVSEQEMFGLKRVEAMLFENFWNFLLYKLEAEKKEIQQQIQEDNPKARKRNQELLKKIEMMKQMVDMVGEDDAGRSVFFMKELEETVLKDVNNIKKVLQRRYLEAKLIEDWYTFMNARVGFWYMSLEVARFREMVEMVMANEYLRSKTMVVFRQMVRRNYYEDTGRRRERKLVDGVEAHYIEVKRILVEAMLGVMSAEEVMEVSSAETIDYALEILKSRVEAEEILEILKRKDSGAKAVRENLEFFINYMSMDDIMRLLSMCSVDDFKMALKVFKKKKLNVGKIISGLPDGKFMLMNCFEEIKKAGVKKEMLVEKIANGCVKAVMDDDYYSDKRMNFIKKREKEFAPYVIKSISALPKREVIRFFEKFEEVITEEELLEILRK